MRGGEGGRKRERREREDNTLILKSAPERKRGRGKEGVGDGGWKKSQGREEGLLKGSRDYYNRLLM